VKLFCALKDWGRASASAGVGKLLYSEGAQGVCWRRGAWVRAALQTCPGESMGNYTPKKLHTHKKKRFFSGSLRCGAI